jgi:hypothetical protein
MNVATADDLIALRQPEEVMRLDRLGSMHATRLSFARVLLRRIVEQGWTVGRSTWNIDPQGVGYAVYRVDTPRRPYSLVAFSQDLPSALRTDRVIAEAWDTSYVLYDGVPDAREIERLAGSVPLQEAGRFTERELVLCRANKSVRLFETVVSELAGGRQPPAALIEAVGYLMRTTAVYGNGKFGIADRDLIADRAELAGPFAPEMLTVWLIRGFTVDLVEHCARARSPEMAVPLAPALRRRLGVGNSTGLGMAPFLVRHPILFHHWILAREKALATVRAVRATNQEGWIGFARVLAEAHAEVRAWRTGDRVQSERLVQLGTDLDRLASEAERIGVNAERPWDRLYVFAEAALGLEAQELLVSLLLEIHGDIVDHFAAEMGADEAEGFSIDGGMSCGALLEEIEALYGWAARIDFGRPEATARFWYVSAEKLEPRLGERSKEPGAELEQPLTVARDVERLRGALKAAPRERGVADFLREEPELRHVVRRVQLVSRFPYAEIRDNLLEAGMRPIDMLRCKLAFFGATRFDPRSDRWLRICLFSGAPFPDELGTDSWRDR